jgi:cell division protein ZipA
MDISIRDWMIIIGGLLIVAVLLDGYRRMRNNSNKVKVALAPVPEGDIDLTVSHELPNGGARVIGRDDSQLGDPLTGGDDAVEPLPGFNAVAGENLDLLADISEPPEAPSAASSEVESEVLMLHVVARDEQGFAGVDILQVLLGFELRFGEMNFFHRHEQPAGRGPIVFSVANMLQPGVFDIDAMSEFHTPGLIFFMTLPGPRDMMEGFELMADTARGVAENLAGDLLDDTRSVATRQTLEHMRQRVRDLERRLLARQG